ncbi:hypothetical protein Ferp_1261 [Ferroglobus placidus DSM 10642]|uniref:Uncharacterized protein n=1 Tax=Ferroglobus placidus (strain DSM 10642 / AEDII12DO) TaxID=589924 RepID=D3RY52_FERPA|nr:hypothetical protein [Ferroglobus placidus]ADC65415.1 hypothetical protein Ferp_1261 [Ferroglobus placidus DSM 10642]
MIRALIVAAIYALAYYYLKWNELLVAMVFSISYFAIKRSFRHIFMPPAVYFLLAPVAKQLNFPLPEEIILLLFSFALLRVDFGKYQSFSTAASVILLILSGFLLKDKLPFGNYFFLLIVALTAVIFFTVLLPELSGKLEFLRNLRGTILLLSFAVVIYSSIRELIPLPPMRDFADWIVVSLLVLKTVSAIRSEIVEEELIKEVRRFEREVERINNAEKLFIDFGVKDKLIFSLSEVLFKSGFKSEEVAEILRPLIYYSDRKIPKYAFSWEKRRIEKANRRRREEVINEIRRKMEEVR